MELTLATFGILLAFCAGYFFRHLKILNKAQRILDANEEIKNAEKIQHIAENIDRKRKREIAYEFMKWR